MRPVFNKKDAMDEWTPRAEGVPRFAHGCLLTLIAGIPKPTQRSS